MTTGDLARQAAAEASAHALQAGVTIRALSRDETGAATQLLTDIWGTPAVEVPMMVALSHSGAYVAGAFADDALVGVCVGYFSEPLGEALHSHVAGVRPGTQRRGVGYAMKLHQRAWCLERGITHITWTFDPLVSRNAAFNLQRLGVDIAEYLVDFYGDMADGVNAGQGSDRLLASWALDRALVPSPPEPTPPDGTQPDPAHLADASALLTTTADGAPHPHIPRPDARWLSVAVPPDIATLRATDPTAAARWRGAVRGALAPMLAADWRVATFHDHRYLLEKH